MDGLGGTEAHLLASIMIPNFCFTLFLTRQVRPHIKHNQGAGLRIPKFTLFISFSFGCETGRPWSSD